MSEIKQPERVGMRDFRGKFAHYIREARGGRSFLITSHDRVVAEIRPPAAPHRPERRLGGMKGQIWMAPDFDADFPEEMLDAIEGME